MIPEKHKINYRNAAKKINNHIDAGEYIEAMDITREMYDGIMKLKYPKR